MHKTQVCLSFGAVLWAWGSAAGAFPPYRATDAATADPWVLEARLGIARLTRDDAEVEVTAPLLRLNLGLPAGFEIVGEADYAIADGRIGDAAAGAKWAFVSEDFGVGTEVLALLPVPDETGVGVEAQGLGSLWLTALRLHLNAGVFADGRVDPTERGWRAGALAELDLDGARPGLELFARRAADQPTEALIGLGSITEIGAVDLRFGVHAGLTEAAPELTFSGWVSTVIPFVKRED